MSGFYEAGHIRNVANFKLLITYCQNFAATYKPGKPSLAIAALEAKLQQANEVMQNVIAVKRALDNAANLRKDNMATVSASRYILVSHLSYNNKLKPLSQLAELSSEDTSYVSNEKEFQTAALSPRQETMQASITEQMKLEAKLNDALKQRDAVLYDAASGLVLTALEVKKHVKRIFGAQSPQFKQVNSISFRAYVK